MLYVCRVISADIDQSRLDMAKSLGADVLVNTKDKNLKDVRFTRVQKISTIVEIVNFCMYATKTV